MQLKFGYTISNKIREASVVYNKGNLRVSSQLQKASPENPISTKGEHSQYNTYTDDIFHPKVFGQFNRREKTCAKHDQEEQGDTTAPEVIESSAMHHLCRLGDLIVVCIGGQILLVEGKVAYLAKVVQEGDLNQELGDQGACCC